MKSLTNLYINGCSFTAGHDLSKEEQWTTLLSKKLNIDPLNRSVNGQSMDSIVLNTINHLAKIDPVGSVVIIGLTWKERFGLLVNGLTVNITPADLGHNKDNFQDKFRDIKRARLPLSVNNVDKVTLKHNQYLQDDPGHHLPLHYFTKYYEALVDLDLNLELDLLTKHLTSILLLQSFLKQQGFFYKFVKWGDIITSTVEEYPELEHLYSKIDTSNIINYNRVKEKNTITGHPSAKECVEISNLIYKEL